MTTINDIRQHFIAELASKNFTEDRSGGKTIELLGASFLADESAIFGKPNKEYIDAEIAWYELQSTNINDIYLGEKEPPQAWKMTANEHGEINSNYGHLIWSEKYQCQYERALDELDSNPDSRRASMIYTRPSIWDEYNDQFKNDFICTNSVTYYIRDRQLHAVVQMRSNDVIFGYRNDYAWQKYILDLLSWDLHVEPGNIHWQVQNLHVYERHFDLVL
jgi:thymidylate synthase|tara:strand:+ start:414 stop:1070 length:657 start_codon:yes stop_codon:yes gene_type:complete